MTLYGRRKRPQRSYIGHLIFLVLGGGFGLQQTLFSDLFRTAEQLPGVSAFQQQLHNELQNPSSANNTLIPTIASVLNQNGLGPSTFLNNRLPIPSTNGQSYSNAGYAPNAAYQPSYPNPPQPNSYYTSNQLAPAQYPYSGQQTTYYNSNPSYPYSNNNPHPQQPQPFWNGSSWQYPAATGQYGGAPASPTLQNLQHNSNYNAAQGFQNPAYYQSNNPNYGNTLVGQSTYHQNNVANSRFPSTSAVYNGRDTTNYGLGNRPQELSAQQGSWPSTYFPSAAAPAVTRW